MDTGVWIALSTVLGGVIGVTGKMVLDIMRERAGIQREARKDAIAEWQAHVERQDRAIQQLERGFRKCDEERHEGRIEVAELRACLHFCMAYQGSCRTKLIELGHDPGEAPVMPPLRVTSPGDQEAEFDTRQALHTATLVPAASQALRQPPPSSEPPAHEQNPNC